MPENQKEVEEDYADCFFLNKARAKSFVATLARIVWEYNYVNKMFIEHYSKLSNLSSKNPAVNIPPSKEILIFGGYYPLSAGQIQAMLKII